MGFTTQKKSPQKQHKALEAPKADRVQFFAVYGHSGKPRSSFKALGLLFVLLTDMHIVLIEIQVKREQSNNAGYLKYPPITAKAMVLAFNRGLDLLQRTLVLYHSLV